MSQSGSNIRLTNHQFLRFASAEHRVHQGPLLGEKSRYGSGKKSMVVTSGSNQRPYFLAKKDSCHSLLIHLNEVFIHPGRLS